jgi:ribonuclease P protein component
VKFTFPKSERLTQKKIIDSLFQKDSSIVSQRFVYPFRVLYRAGDIKSDSPQILISVPKRKFKKAVDRNLIKRRAREAYRLTKPLFQGLVAHKLPDIMGFIYIGTEIESFELIQKKMHQIFTALTKNENLKNEV